MGFLKKLGLVEDNPDYYAGYDPDLSDVNYDADIDANVDGVTNDNLVSDIYNANSLSDLSKSIFKVEELIDSLPKEMATDTKRTSVLAILSSFGLTTEEVLEDANTRVNLLNAAMTEIVNKNTSKIDESNITIEDLKKQIEDLQKIISDLLLENKTCKDKVEQEVNRIENLIKFIKGETKG